MEALPDDALVIMQLEGTAAITRSTTNTRICIAAIGRLEMSTKVGGDRTEKSQRTLSLGFHRPRTPDLAMQSIFHYANRDLHQTKGDAHARLADANR